MLTILEQPTAGNQSPPIANGPEITITETGYTVPCIGLKPYIITRISPRVWQVEGGRMPHAVRVKQLLGKGDDNPKTAKNEIPTVGLSLFPARGCLIPGVNLCMMAKVCVKPCLAHQGQGPVPGVMASRLAKTVLFVVCREWFLATLDRELTNHEKRNKGAETIGARLNMFSDIHWEDLGIIAAHPGIVFYDYTKEHGRSGWIAPNYYITFSYDGTNETEARRVIASGGVVAVVFYNEGGKCGKAAIRQTIPAAFFGVPVFDGNVTDWRPGDTGGQVCGLVLRARTYENRNAAIRSGFAILA
jgi:hypothetical protein